MISVCFSPIYEIDQGGLQVHEDEILAELAQNYIYDICVFDDHFHTAASVRVSLPFFNHYMT